MIMKFSSAKCPKCGAKLVDNAKFCPKCGASVKVIDNFLADAVQQNDEKFQDKVEEVKESDLKDKQSLGDGIKNKLSNKWNSLDTFCKIITVGILITIIMLLISIILHRGLSIFISIIQGLGFLLALLLHKGIIKSQKKWLKFIALTVAIFMVILNIMSCFIGNKSENTKTNSNVVEEEKPITIQLPVGTDDCMGNNYLEINNILSESGFVNISLEAIEDLQPSESDKVGQIETVSINGNTNFEKDQTFQENAKIIINYHAYAKCTVNIHVNFVPNLVFSKYDVDFNFDGENEGTLTHGENADYQLTVDPGEYSVEFVSVDSSSVKGETTVKVNGDVKVSYKIECYKDKISIEIEDGDEADDAKNAESEAEEDTKNSGKEDTVSEAEENLTVDNCPELAAMLSNKAEIDASYSEFASKYKGRTIEFDGRIDYCSNYENYDTRFDYLVSSGDYDPDHQIGPTFKFENVNYYDLNTDMDTVSVGWNVHIIAKVESFDANSGLFYLDPVSVTKR